MFENELALFQRSREAIWTDEYISKNLLAAHLDESYNGASRKEDLRIDTINWINTIITPHSRIIDLGCGPGLYTYELGKNGHTVLGLDFSRESIEYARKNKQVNGSVEYTWGNYLEDDIAGIYDAAIMIWCDFGALIPGEQEILLKKIKNVLTGKGVFIFDVFGEGLTAKKRERRSWNISGGNDFWSSEPYFLLEEIKHFEKAHAVGTRDYVITQNSPEIHEYIMWDQYYNRNSITKLMEDNGFKIKQINREVIKSKDDDVLFVVAESI